MSAIPSMESLREALAPVEALRGEHSQLETWMRESMTAMDALHGELAEWQRELTRQQAQLDQREAALNEGAAVQESRAIADLERRLAQSGDALRQLEDENSQQLSTIEDLNRELAVAKAESRLVNRHAREVAALLETEHEREAEAELLWKAEFRETKRLLERQGTLLELLAGSRHSSRTVVDAACSTQSNAC